MDKPKRRSLGKTRRKRGNIKIFIRLQEVYWILLVQLSDKSQDLTKTVVYIYGRYSTREDFFWA